MTSSLLKVVNATHAQLFPHIDHVPAVYVPGLRSMFAKRALVRGLFTKPT